MTMINLKTKKFKEKLEKVIGDIGDVMAVYQVGSSLYLENFGDIDLIVITKTPKFIRKFFTHNNKWVNVQGAPISKMVSVDNPFIAELQDAKCIMGTPIEFIDFLGDEQLQKNALNSLEQIAKRETKHNWNYLLAKFKIENKSHTLTDKQIALLQKAHDNIEEYGD